MRLLDLDSYNVENDRTFLKSIEEHVRDPYIKERLINSCLLYTSFQCSQGIVGLLVCI